MYPLLGQRREDGKKIVRERLEGAPEGQIYRFMVGLKPVDRFTGTRIAVNCFELPEQDTVAVFRRGGIASNTPAGTAQDLEHDLPLLTAAFSELPDGITIGSVSPEVLILRHQSRDALRALRFAYRLVQAHACKVGFIAHLSIRYGEPDGRMLVDGRPSAFTIL